MKLMTTVLIAAALGIAITACGSTKKTASAPSSAAVTISNYKFGPPSLTVKAGARVTWTNSDASPHTATASGAFDTGTLKKGAHKTLVLSKPGTYSYVCSFHPFMNGTITVE